MLIRGFTPFDNVLRLFETQHNVTVTTGEAEATPGGRTTIQGVKPLISWPSAITDPTTAVTVAVGYRDNQDDDSLTWTAESTMNSRTRFSGFRNDAYYQRIRVTTSTTGGATTMNSLTGVEVQAVESGVS